MFQISQSLFMKPILKKWRPSLGTYSLQSEFLSIFVVSVSNIIYFLMLHIRKIKNVKLKFIGITAGEYNYKNLAVIPTLLDATSVLQDGEPRMRTWSPALWLGLLFVLYFKFIWKWNQCSSLDLYHRKILIPILNKFEMQFGYQGQSERMTSILCIPGDWAGDLNEEKNSRERGECSVKRK